MRRICDKQKKMISEAQDISKKLKQEGADREALKERTDKLYQSLIEFNKKELNEGIGETQDIDDKKKNETSIFSKIFKTVLSISLLLALVNYVLFGPKGFKLPKYQNMQSASTKK